MREWIDDPKKVLAWYLPEIIFIYLHQIPCIASNRAYTCLTPTETGNTNMNAFAQAHKLTKEIIQPGDNYAATFALCLKHLNQKVNPMIETINGMIADSQDYIARLEAFKATNPTGYIVVTGTHRMPIHFIDWTAQVSNVETANRWSDLRIAEAKARQVTNGAKEKGVAVWVVDQIEWEVKQQNKLIADLTEAKKNHK